MCKKVEQVYEQHQQLPHDVSVRWPCMSSRLCHLMCTSGSGDPHGWRPAGARQPDTPKKSARKLYAGQQHHCQRRRTLKQSTQMAAEGDRPQVWHLWVGAAQDEGQTAFWCKLVSTVDCDVHSSPSAAAQPPYL